MGCKNRRFRFFQLWKWLKKTSTFASSSAIASFNSFNSYLPREHYFCLPLIGFTSPAEKEQTTIIQQAIGSTDTISKKDEIIEDDSDNAEEDLMYNDEIFEEEETTYSTEIDTNTSEKPFEEHQLDSTQVW